MRRKGVGLVLLVGMLVIAALVLGWLIAENWMKLRAAVVSEPMAAAGVVANCLVSLFTLLLVIATLYLARDAQRGRKEQERQRKEAAFRASLYELAECITSFRERMNHSLEFPRLVELLGTVWIDARLWERIVGGSLVIIRSRGKFLPAQTPDLILDLYLTQLARYVFCEMRRQHLDAPEGIWNTTVFQPVGESDWTPDLSQEKFAPPQPDDPVFRKCRLDMLIEEGKQAAKKRVASLTLKTDDCVDCMD